MRINKFISESGVCSRREADAWIEAGRVAINGKTATLGSPVESGDRVTVGDCTLAAGLQFGRFRKLAFLDDHPRLAAWDQRYRARPTAASVLVL